LKREQNKNSYQQKQISRRSYQIILFVFLLWGVIFCSSGLAQNKGVSKGRFEPKWHSVGIQLGANLGSIKRFNANGEEITNTFISNLNSITQVKLGYTAGLSACYKLNNSIEFELGMQFSDRGYQFAKQEIIYGDPIDPSRGGTANYFRGTYSPTSIQQVAHFYYLEIPFFTHFSLGKKKLRMVGSLGISHGYLHTSTNTNLFEFKDSENIRSTRKNASPYNRFTMNGSVGLGVEYALGSTTKIRMQPIFTYGFLNLIDAPIGAHLWSSGITVGVYNLFASK